MAQNAPIIQVDCASCGTTYRLALPSVIVKKTHKPMSFRCNNCSYKFQIHPKEILEQPLVAETLILVESNGLQVHHNLESVADLIASGQYGAEDLIRVFGQEWTMLGDEPSLSALFDVAQNRDETLDNHENELVQPDSVQREDNLIAGQADSSASSEEQAQTTIEEHVEKVEDVSLEFDEDSVEFSEHFSEIDPFATNSTEDDTVFTETLDAKETASEASLEDDDFDDWLVEELQDELAGSLDDNDLIESESDDWTITESVEPEISGLSSDIDEPVVDELGGLDDLDINESFTIEDVQENQRDGASTGVQNEFARDFEQDATDDDFDDFAVEDVQANLLAELDLEESSFEDTVEALKSDQDDPTQATDVERTLQALKNDLLGGGESQSDGSSQKSQDESTQSVAPAFEAPAFEAEVEVDDLENPDTIVGSERHPDPSDSGQNEVQKPKKRLSFSNKVPEVQKVEKREINQLYVFAGIIFFSMGVLGWVLWNSDVDKQEFAGMEVNSNLLKEMETPKEGLQENSQTEGKAPELAKTNADGDSPPTEDGTEGSGTGEDTQIVSDVTEPAMPFPDVLPDVPEEGIDFANDKSPRALTREGYRALRDNKPDLAIKLFELALKKDPDFADAVLGLGRTYKKRGELQLAVQSFCRHSELPSSSFESATMVEEVGLSQNILAQMGSSCEG